MKKQVIIIHGGETFNTYGEYLELLRSWRIEAEDLTTVRTDWKDSLPVKLGSGYQVIAPRMPGKMNAKYIEWKIWFEKYLPLLDKEILLAGHSLGGLFLAKYLAENTVPNRVLALFLVAAPFGGNGQHELADFRFGGCLDRVSGQAEKIFIYHSDDDLVVSSNDAMKYKKALPGAILRKLIGRRHFNGEDFPELIKDMISVEF